MSSLVQFNLNINKDYIPLINDLIRMAVIQIVAQILFVTSSRGKETFFNEMFIQTLFYILLGVLVYWLIIRKIFIIR